MTAAQDDYELREHLRRVWHGMGAMNTSGRSAEEVASIRKERDRVAAMIAELDRSIESR